MRIYFSKLRKVYQNIFYRGTMRINKRLVSNTKWKMEMLKIIREMKRFYTVVVPQYNELIHRVIHCEKLVTDEELKEECNIIANELGLN